jgi:limonene-1,2-epoxide hydrolase
MPHALLPAPARVDAADLADPQTVVEAFLAALAASDIETATALIDDDIVYANVGLPTVRGREEMDRVFALLGRRGVGFEVYLHAVSADGPVVLTERTDAIVTGPMRTQFWVWGRFEVHDGRITLWRDSFDFVDVLRGTLRGLVGAVVPGVRPAPPSGPAVAPGR